MSHPASSPLLRQLAESIRERRRRRGLSRRDLADASGVSIRFLADIEAGKGNPSLRRTDDLARALGLSVAALLTPPARPRSERIALLGLRGAGKTTVGRALARHLGRPFVELDARIEVAAGLSLAQIFEIHGEQYFHRMEREVLVRFLAEERSAVLATGGGLVMEQESFDLLRAGCVTVWLRARPGDHYNRVLAQGDRRPMADNPHAMAELRELLARREPLYSRADLSVDTSHLAVEETTRQLAGQLLALAPSSPPEELS